MTQEQLQTFRYAFKKATDGKASLPKKFDYDKVNEVELFADRMRGRCSFMFIISKDVDEHYTLEYYLGTDYGSSHALIKQDGTILRLKNLEYTEGTEKDKLYNDLLSKGLI